MPDSIRPLDPDHADRLHDGLHEHQPRRHADHAAVTNQLFNFGWEYVWHCHILSHEEMDMMRPMKFNVDQELWRRHPL